MLSPLWYLSRAVAGQLRVRARISWHFGTSAGRADAKRRDAGDVVTSSRSGNAADARPPPRPGGLLAPRPAISYDCSLQDATAWETTAECQVIFARALRSRRRLELRHLLSATMPAIEVNQVRDRSTALTIPKPSTSTTTSKTTSRFGWTRFTDAAGHCVIWQSHCVSRRTRLLCLDKTYTQT